MIPKIVFENDFLMVIDKPAGWISNDSQTAGRQPVVQKWISENFNFELAKDAIKRSGLVHRLDKETSGLLIVAKNEETFNNLQTHFKERLIEKEYIALVHGDIDSDEGEINVPVGRLPWSRKKFGILPGGRESITNYKVLTRYLKDNEKFTLLNLFPKTGRTHQIRVHLKYLGHPVVSDDKYAGRKTARNDRKWCPRLFLHAAVIKIKSLNGFFSKNIQSEIPNDLSDVLKSLEKV